MTQEKQLTIGDELYKLRPGQNAAIEQFYDVQHRYGALLKASQSAFTRDCPETELSNSHVTVLRQMIPKELCEGFVSEIKDNPEAMEHPDVLKILLPYIFTDAVDLQLRSYFNSEYCLFWYSFYGVNDDETDGDYFKRWHCDGGPSKHLKIIVYLNGHDEHGSDTAFYPEAATERLKEEGYIFTALNDRKTDIEPLMEHFGIEGKSVTATPGAGDTLIFNPGKLAHKAIVSNKGQKRYVFNACIVASPKPWQAVMENHCAPVYGCQSFEGFAAKLLRSTSNRESHQGLIEVASDNKIVSTSHLHYVLHQMFKQSEFAESVYQDILSQDPNLKECNDLATLFNLLKTHIGGAIKLDNLDLELVNKLQEIAQFDANYADSFKRYTNLEKPDPTGVFWPNPVHPKHPASKFEQLPFVEKHPIMDMNTPIGSAGSCFAFEIAKVFQQENYNYVVTERNDDPNSGLIVDGYNPGDQFSKFSANYGILFNTPSFLQLAQKAFGIRHFNKFLVELPTGGYFDPYRENVTFINQDSFLADYDRHITAVRNAFLEAEIFVVTLGLNECWQFADGTVMSRNPRENMYHLVQHKTLSVMENIDNIQQFYDIIKAHNPKFKLIISVSPIPFLATGRAKTHHVIEANTHSKAVLRVAADELVRKNEDMYYLPSYELVTECVENPWTADARHVTPETVNKVVGMFKEIFVK